MYQCILYPVDNSQSSRHALEIVQSIALAHAAQVVLCHSFHVNLSYPQLSPGQFDFIEQTFRQEAERLLETYASALAQAGVSVKSMLLRGDPADLILEQAQLLSADLIVMGRQGTRTLKYLLLGSVSQYVLNHASCPVMIVPPQT